MRFVLTLLLMLAAAPGCTRADEVAAQEAVHKILKNSSMPPKYGKFTRIGKNAACMTVNPQDATGKYLGETFIMLEKENDEWTAGYWKELTTHDLCVVAMTAKYK